MTNPAYTQDDLRAEAARQLSTASTDPDFMGIGEQMDGTFIESTIVDPDPQTGTERITGRTWDELDRDEFGAVMRKIDDLINGAADVSDWAIQLGADGMEPEERTLWMGPADKPAVRVMFAFAEDMSDADRDDFISEIAAHMVTTA